MNNEIYHYGVKGMKWGVRTKSAVTEYRKSKKRLSSAKKKYKTDKTNKNRNKVRKARTKVVTNAYKVANAKFVDRGEHVANDTFGTQYKNIRMKNIATIASSELMNGAQKAFRNKNAPLTNILGSAAYIANGMSWYYKTKMVYDNYAYANYVRNKY